MTASATSTHALATLALLRAGGPGAWIEVTGSSMHPLIRHGDELYVEFPPRGPRLGEIVVFPDGELMVAHRLVYRRHGERGDVLITRGDGTLTFDPPFPADRALGIVRACRRGPERAPVPIADSGAPAVAIAGISAVAGCLLAGVEQLPSQLRRPLGRIVRRLAPGVVALSARAAARSGHRGSINR